MRLNTAVVSYQPLEVFFEKFHGLDEATLSRRHDHVDGVEIFLGLSGFLKSLVPEIWLFFGLGLGEKGHPINALFRIRKICG